MVGEGGRRIDDCFIPEGEHLGTDKFRAERRQAFKATSVNSNPQSASDTTDHTRCALFSPFRDGPQDFTGR